MNEFKTFQRRWADTKMADKAQERINELLKDVVNRIKKQPATPQTTNALMQLFIRFPRTETSDEIARTLDKRGKIEALNQRMGRVRQGK